jgi:hypothetical protein
MIYAEAAYFEGNHCAHCATRDEHLRLKRKLDDARAALAARSLRRKP